MIKTPLTLAVGLAVAAQALHAFEDGKELSHLVPKNVVTITAVTSAAYSPDTVVMNWTSLLPILVPSVDRRPTFDLD